MSDVDGQDGQDIVTNDDETEESLLQGAENDDEIGGDGANETAEDPEIEAIKRKMKEMEEEAEMLKEMHSDVEKQLNSSGPMTAEEKKDVDARSIYVGNVDYSATAQELEAHFHGCGSINRVTILCDRYSGHPKGYAYIEFADKDSVETAKALDESLFKGRQIKVTPKRTNQPGMSCTDRPPRGRGYRGRGYGRGFSRRPRFRRGYYHYSPY